MKTGLSLSQLATKIEANQAAKHDFVADTRELTFRVDHEHKPSLIALNGESYRLQPHAVRQIAAHTKVPADYLERMIAEAPRLAAENINEWLTLNPARRMVRTLGTQGRAFLSDRYQRIENEEIAHAALPVLADVPGIRITSSEVTDSRLYIQAVTSRTQFEVKKGDIVEAGVMIRNSEVGLGSVSIAALCWRLVCLNGMVMPDGNYRRNHVGRRVREGEDLNVIYRDDTRAADDRAVLLKVRDTVAAALDEARFKLQVDKMRALADPAAKVAGDPAKAIEVLAKKVGINDGERSGILRSLIEGHDLTAWGMLNAVTHQAHEAADYDRAVDFETMGGKLLNMPPSEWREVLEAA